VPDLRVYVRSGFFILLCIGGGMITKNRAELIELLSFWFTTDKLMSFGDETLENLYIEYVVLAEDYV
jgi:hypothetical protein